MLPLPLMTRSWRPVEVDVVQVEPHQLGPPDPARPQALQDRPVAPALELREPGEPCTPNTLATSSPRIALGSGRPIFGQDRVGGRVVVAPPAMAQILVERPQRRDLAAHRARRVPPRARQMRLVAPGCRRTARRPAPRTAAAAFSSRSRSERARLQERAEVFEVALVRLARARRRPADREVLLGEAGDLRIGRQKLGLS